MRYWAAWTGRPGSRQICVTLTLQGLSATVWSRSGSVFASKESSAKVQIDAWQHRRWVRHLRAGTCVKDQTVRAPPMSSVIRDTSRPRLLLPATVAGRVRLVQVGLGVPGRAAWCRDELVHRANVAPCCTEWRHWWRHCWPNFHWTETAQAYAHTHT